MVAAALARIGVSNVVLIDADRVEEHNLDRLLYAGIRDVGVHKVDLVARHLKRSATAADFRAEARIGWIQERSHYLAALDCDILFAAVDRPLPKDVLNHIAYAHCVPVVFGGVFTARKAGGRLGQATWSAVVAGPGHRCLRCDGQYTSSDVVMERDGSLDDPSWWPATTKVHYSFVPNRLSAAHDQCHAHCSVDRKAAAGDSAVYPFIVDPEPRRRLRWSSVFTARLVKSVRRIIGR